MQTTTQSPQETARYIISLYNQFGGEDYIGEPVSQLEHMQQCAQLAEQEGYDEEVVLAGFFHDIGHFCEHLMPVQHMDGFGIVDHEKLGADFLRSQGFSEKIAQLVQNHVEAKRYLTFRYPEYYEKLSEASKRTLEFQGGRMTAEEAAAFEADPLFELHIKLRRWDEGAKLEHQPLQPMLYYESMMVRHLQQTTPH
ncbi:MAG: HDIG domain-containing protein [Chitinophagaceae bacterium]|nr:HDIG domain-containing protein [Chitinophagaceae bacterium]